MTKSATMTPDPIVERDIEAERIRARLEETFGEENVNDRFVYLVKQAQYALRAVGGGGRPLPAEHLAVLYAISIPRASK